MTEKELFTAPNGIEGIPSDTPSPWKISLLYKYDIFLQFNDSTAETGIYLPGIRFRRSGCGHFFLIAEELSFLPEAFMNYQGKISPDFENQTRTIDDPSTFAGTEIRVGKKQNESKYVIKGIPDGNANPEDNNKFLDIEITNEGNAILTMRDTRRNNQASMKFKTAENGGRYPIMAAVFTRIAERIANAKRR